MAEAELVWRKVTTDTGDREYHAFVKGAEKGAYEIGCAYRNEGASPGYWNAWRGGVMGRALYGSSMKDIKSQVASHVREAAVIGSIYRLQA